MKQKRWKSKVLWIAIIAQVVTILQLTGVIELTDAEMINNIATGILQLLVLLGIINDATTKDSL